MLYLSTFEGTGTKLDPFRAVGMDNATGSTIIDLRSDPTQRNGHCLLWQPYGTVKGGIALHEYPDRIIPKGACTKFEGKTGHRAERRRAKDFLADLLIDKLRPTNKQMLEIWVGNKLWFSQRIFRGGATGSDSFTRANANPLDGTWQTFGWASNMKIVSNQVQSTVTAAFGSAYWTAATFGNDQYCQITVGSAIPGDYDFGGWIRAADAGSAEGYSFFLYSVLPGIWKAVAGSFTQLTSYNPGTPVANDTAYIEASGTSLAAKFNGLYVSTTTDTSLTSGKTGMWIFEITTPDTITAWEGGDLPVNLYNGLMGYWKMDDASGATSTDSHGNNDMADNNTVGSGTGIINTCRIFNGAGTNRFLNIASNASLVMGDIDFTLQYWVFFFGLGADMGLVTKYAGAGNIEYFSFIRSTDTLVFDVSNDGTATVEVQSAATFVTSQWYHVLCWHDAGANTINIQVDNGTVDTVAHTTGVFQGTAQFLHGAFNQASPFFYFNGALDEIGLWKRVLAPYERAALYNSGAALSYDDFGTIVPPAGGAFVPMAGFPSGHAGMALAGVGGGLAG